MWAIFILGAFVVAEFGFCRCVRVFCGLKLVLFFLPLFGVVFGVGVWFVGNRNSSVSLSERLEV